MSRALGIVRSVNAEDVRERAIWSQLGGWQRRNRDLNEGREGVSWGRGWPAQWDLGGVMIGLSLIEAGKERKAWQVQRKHVL